MTEPASFERVKPSGLLERVIFFFLSNRLVTFLCVLAIVVFALAVAPFDWNLKFVPRAPVAVDAIPDIGENQQIVFAAWPGRSPQDIEDQVTYPLTVSLMGVPEVKTVRSFSMLGFSSVYVIFNEGADFYWSRTRLLEKLSSLPSGTLPEGVRPVLGPDATALGQVYWYTLEGRDEKGRPTGGWDLQELRSIQDWQVRYALLSAEGISEVASVGGFVKEYQVDVDPELMRVCGVTLGEVYDAVRMSNIDTGARTIEVNRVEYVIRGIGFVRSIKDIEESVVKVADNVPVRVGDVASVSEGPALRRGALDKGGTEAVGGVAVVRYQNNPLAAIKNLKEKIARTAASLPEKAVVDYTRVSREQVESFARSQGFDAYAGEKLNQDEWLGWLKKTGPPKRPDWIKFSKVTIVPFYDRTGLIRETLGTLETALTEEIMVTVIVILVMLMHLPSSLVISLTLPLSVLLCFIAMKLFGVDANIVALSGIAIAIGTIVDMGVIVCENIVRHLENDETGADRMTIIFRAVSEVASAVVTAIMTTVVSFLPVFTMTGPEGRLFKPLAFTKTFALLASVVGALTIVPTVASVLFGLDLSSTRRRAFGNGGVLAVSGIACLVVGFGAAGLVLIVSSLFCVGRVFLSAAWSKRALKIFNFAAAFCVGLILVRHWMPLGAESGIVLNCFAVLGPIGALLGFFALFLRFYSRTLRWCLENKILFLSLPLVVVCLGALSWLGAGRVFFFVPGALKTNAVFRTAERVFPGLGKEFMPSLDEGSFLYMPTTMPHASIGEAMEVLSLQDRAFASLPEIESAVGKLGRAETALDPAPVSMIETVINYKSEYLEDENGRRLSFCFDPDKIDFFRNERGEPVNAPDGKPYKVQGAFVFENGHPVPDPDGGLFRLWRKPLDPALNPGREAWGGIRTQDDIWDEIVGAARVPGTTSAPRLQPIAARLVMLQSGMRAPMGIKIHGSSLETIESFGLELEKQLRKVPGVEPDTVFADRIVGKPYLEIVIRRDEIARYGIYIRSIQDIIETAIAGRAATYTVEGRERYAVRVRYLRELRDSPQALERILVPAPGGAQVPLVQLADIRYVRGPQVIKSEDTFLTGYVTFDKKPGMAEVDVVENARRFLNEKEKSGEFVRPAGITYNFAGNYENQLRAARTLSFVLPLALLVIFLILYFEFKSVPVTAVVFSAILVAWSGGFILVWLYGQDWFLNMSVFGVNLRELFQVHPLNLSVAVWVGFLALFGIASDDGVVIVSYLNQSFERKRPETIAQIRQATLEGAWRRIRPCLITSATTILALLPVLSSTGRGSDIMVPMAVPSFGGMLIVLVSVFIVPVLYCWRQERRLVKKG